MNASPTQRTPELDGLRGIAIAAVLAFHLRYLDPLPNAGCNSILLRLAMPGWLGVDVFFVLSGFLITGNILRTRTHPSFWRNFYLRRAARILPALLCLLPVVCVAGGYPGARRLAPYLLFLSNFAILSGNIIPGLLHLWSLAIEEQFYLVWPLAAARLEQRTLFRIALAVALFSATARGVLTCFHVPGPVSYLLTLTHADGLAAGAALALAGDRALHRLRKYRRVLACSAAAIWLGGWAALGFIYSSTRSSALAVAIVPVVVLTVLAIQGVLESTLPRLLRRMLANTALRWLGRRSYAIYLWHFPLMGIAAKLASSSPLWMRMPAALRGVSLVAAVLCITALIAELSWRWVERPALAAAQRLTGKRELLLTDR